MFQFVFDMIFLVVLLVGTPLVVLHFLNREARPLTDSPTFNFVMEHRLIDTAPAMYVRRKVKAFYANIRTVWHKITVRR